MSFFLVAYLIVVLGFVGRQYEGVRCKGMDIIVRDSLERGLITAGDVKNLISLDHPDIAGIPIARVNSTAIEESLNRYPAISNAQVYADIQGRLIIEISQRSPIARIEDRNHDQYYIDRDGYVIPANLDYAPYLLHINGEIPGTIRKKKRIVTGDETGEQDALMEELLKLAVYIHADPFWKSQIVQVYINGNGEFELIPRVGSHIILFGTGKQMENKFFKLKTLYREGFSHMGWNQYEVINLKYNNQVICTKR
jgi:cell division protein FtsQ